jgi:hypothetical protein
MPLFNPFSPKSLPYSDRLREKFLRQNGGHLAQPVSIILFTSAGLQPLSPPSTEGNALAEMVHQIKPSIRPRGIYTFPLSILALDHLAQDEAKKPGRKMLVWLGTGWTTPAPDPRKPVFTSADERDQRHHFDLIVLLSTGLREARIALYGGYADSAYFSREFMKGAKKASDVDGRMLALDVLALQSGGRGQLMAVNRDSDLGDQLNNILAEATAFYTLSFDPPRTDRTDEYHALKVVVSKPGLTARTNTGFYNQPELAQPEREPAPAEQQASAASRVKAGAPFTFKPVTVQQLELTLSDLKARPDADAARQLSTLQLTEHLSSTKLSSLKTSLPGAKTRAALVALADASVFLNPPSAEISADAAPDLVAQRRMVALAVDYLGKVLSKLPNFYATRTTARYEDTLDKPESAGTAAPGGQPFHPAGNSTATVVYRDGKEVVDPATAKGKKPEEKGLITRGTFGPILSTVMVDAAHSEMDFSRWEQGTAGSQAIFHYTVPKNKSHYEVAYRTPSGQDQSYDLQQRTGYHGEVAINPDTGAILRLTVEADLDPGLPILRADIAVKYEPVEIGGKSYICPVRSVSLSKGRTVVVLQDRYGNSTSLGPEVTLLSDVTFGEYHVFRAETRVLTGDDPTPKEK